MSIMIYEILLTILVFKNINSLFSGRLVHADISQFGKYIEGLAVDSNGYIFATNYGGNHMTNTLGQVYPNQQPVFHLNYRSHLNGLQYMSKNLALAADALNHRVLILYLVNGIVSYYATFCENNEMLQPNDLTISENGDVYLSGMRYTENNTKEDGDVWLCRPNYTKRLELMGRTNGIEISPDYKNLYVSESLNKNGTPIVQKIWRYDIRNDGTIYNKILFFDFTIDNTTHIDIDGMRTDKAGNLYVTRNGGANVSILSKYGYFKGNIKTSFPDPTSLAFGDNDGKTLYIVGSCDFIESIGRKSSKGCLDYLRLGIEGRGIPIFKDITYNLTLKLDELKWEKY